MTGEHQADVMADHADYVENERFSSDDVMLVAAYVVGSNNNFEARNPEATATSVASIIPSRTGMTR